MSARNNPVYAEFLKDRRKTFPCGNGKHSHGFSFFFEFLLKSPVFFEHILNFNSVEFAEFKSLRQSDVGRVGVNVYFNKLQIAYYYNAISDSQKFFSQLVDIRYRRFLFKVNYKELRAVSKLNISERDYIRIVARKRGGFFFFFFRNGRFFYFLADESLVHTRKDTLKPRSARVHYSRFFKNGQQFGCKFQRFVALFQYFGKKRLEILVFRATRKSAFRSHSCDRKNSTLFRF